MTIVRPLYPLMALFLEWEAIPEMYLRTCHFLSQTWTVTVRRKMPAGFGIYRLRVGQNLRVRVVPVMTCFLAWVTSLFRNSVRTRSEEHTSELQSRENLVCRLLL